MGGTRRGNDFSLGEDLKSQYTGRHLGGVEEGPGRREAEARARKSHLFQLWVGACAVAAVFNVVTLGSRSVLVNRLEGC